MGFTKYSDTYSVMVSAPVMVPAPVIPDDTKAKCSGAGIGGGLRQENRYRHRYRWRYHLTLRLEWHVHFFANGHRFRGIVLFRKW